MSTPRYQFETEIRTTPERLWQALTDPATTARYYIDCAVGATGGSGGRSAIAPRTAI